MNEHDFISWFRGFVETNNEPPTKEQWDIIKKKLDSVFEPLPPLNPQPYEYGPWKRYEWWSEPYWVYTPMNTNTTVE